MRKPIKTNFVPELSSPASKPPVAWIGVVIVIVILAFVAGWAWSKYGVAPTESLTQPIEEVIGEDIEEEEEVKTPVTVNIPGALTIDWVDVAGQKARSTNYLLNSVVFGDNQLLPEDNIGPKAFYLGTVVGGKYDGYELQSYIAGISGMGVDYANFYLLVPQEKVPNSSLVILDNYAFFTRDTFTAPVAQTTASVILGEEGLARLASSVDTTESGLPAIILNTGSKIAEFELADFVEDERGRKYNLIGVWQRTDYPDEITFSDAATGTELTNGITLSLYNTSEPKVSFANELFYYVRQDGRTVWYNLDLDLWEESDEADDIQGSLRSFVTGVPAITWNDGTKNTDSYFAGTEGGCGTVSGLHVVEIGEAVDLVEAGLTADGEKVYEPSSYEGEYYQNGFNMWKNQWDEARTFEQFVSAHPYFYFQDSFSRWVEFRNTSVTPMAECGKPVIYLYPETTTDIDVSLYPQGGFTYTEPVYNNGWRVTASPDGTLINRDDGQVYPYLFWEGRGGMYVSPSRYWVVEQAKVHDFLVSTLARLGLNEKETADFLEFWEPRMQSAAYYKIGFYGTGVMDQLAPLSLSEKPDTIIRILMDYQPLESPIKANPPVLPAMPVREGFTVIEWGGVLR